MGSEVRGWIPSSSLGRVHGHEQTIALHRGMLKSWVVSRGSAIPTASSTTFDAASVG